MAHISRQRQRYDEALQLSQEASAALQPLHDDLAELSPSFDGIVYFARDRWHKNNASAVATVQPRSSDAERFAFYKEHIAHRRVDLGATALGYGLRLEEPRFLRSRMNPEKHITWTNRTLIDGVVTGGVQAAFNLEYGAVPDTTEALHAVWRTHEATAREVADGFNRFSGEVHSIGDTLELNVPATPNAYIVSWDLRHSTPLALDHYGTVRNYLLDTKGLFKDHISLHDTHIHDTGDGQDVSLWIPETSSTFDRANKDDIRRFGTTRVLPLIQRLLDVHEALARDYSDIQPTINFAVGLGYIEHDLYDEYTGQAYWENAQLLKSHPRAAVSYTDRAHDVLA